MESFFFKLSIMLVPGLLAITCHEVAHGYAAWRLGDPTARMLGRLTLNPFKHIDPFGTVVLPILLLLIKSPMLFGWAKPVPVDFSNLRKPKTDMIWVSLAGPMTNLGLALVSAMAYRLITSLGNPAGGYSFVLLPLIYMLLFSVKFNLFLMLFNLIPVPPLDGGRVLVGLLPDRLSMQFARLEPYGMIVLFALLMFGNLTGNIILPMINLAFRLLITY
ncbi:MAG TPA: site-2 protease family protein [Deltaproteobacteria bacterium]|nr:site-2 protease family protein [Deltaproteobacteria bacterium]